jgi:hypothetical protein
MHCLQTGKLLHMSVDGLPVECPSVNGTQEVNEKLEYRATLETGTTLCTDR